MEEWTTVKQVFPTEAKAEKAANIISITESRLSSNPNGPQYSVETEVFMTDAGWQVRWRKVLTGYGGGCSGCGSCGSSGGSSVSSGDNTNPEARLAKVIEFKPRKK